MPAGIAGNSEDRAINLFFFFFFVRLQRSAGRSVAEAVRLSAQKKRGRAIEQMRRQNNFLTFSSTRAIAGQLKTAME